MEELYNEQMINVMLDEYSELDNRLIEYKFDIDKALKSELISGQERLFIFTVYQLKLNIEQTLRINKWDIETYVEIKVSLIEKLEAILNGYKTTTSNYEDSSSESLKELLLEMQTRHINPYQRLSAAMRVDLLAFLAADKDKLAQSVFSPVVDPRGKYWENSRPLKLYDESTTHKNASNDGFYSQDLRNNIIYSEKLIDIAENPAL